MLHDDMTHLSAKLKVRIAQDLTVQHDARTNTGSEGEGDHPSSVSGQAEVLFSDDRRSSVIFCDRWDIGSLTHLGDERESFDSCKFAWQEHDAQLRLHCTRESKSNGARFGTQSLGDAMDFLDYCFEQHPRALVRAHRMDGLRKQLSLARHGATF